MEHLTGSSIGQAPALAPNFRLGWKGLAEANTLAYEENSYLTGVKSFITLAPGLAFVSKITVKYFTPTWRQKLAADLSNL
jgi:hypothetical protein